MNKVIHSKIKIMLFQY